MNVLKLCTLKIKNKVKNCWNKLKSGFTLVEILTTVVIMGVLATAAVPIGQLMIIRQQEDILKDSLSSTRKALDEFYKDYQSYPASFIELRGEAPPNFSVCYMREAPPVNPFSGNQYDWTIVVSGITEYNSTYDAATKSYLGRECYETSYYDFAKHNAKVFQNEQTNGQAKCDHPNCVGYWGIWDIKYPRDDRLAINETLYKDW